MPTSILSFDPEDLPPMSAPREGEPLPAYLDKILTGVLGGEGLMPLSRQSPGVWRRLLLALYGRRVTARYVADNLEVVTRRRLGGGWQVVSQRPLASASFVELNLPVDPVTRRPLMFRATGHVAHYRARLEVGAKPARA